MDLKDVEKLAELGRLEISDDEKKEFLKDLTSILEYVDQVESAPVETREIKPLLRNVFRDDKDPHEPEAYTDKLLEEAPKKQEGYIKVKKIL